MDRTQWAVAPYTEADLQKQFDARAAALRRRGQQVFDDVNAYVDGINAYIADALLDPAKLPAEYAALGKPPQPWKPTDVIAEASLIGGIFGKGGGTELRSALTPAGVRQALRRKAGRKPGTDFRDQERPRGADDRLQRFPYETGSAFANAGLALPDPGSVSSTAVATAPPASARRPPAPRPVGAAAAARRARSRRPRLQLGARRRQHSTTGHPIGVLGPQVGYYLPQILMEEDLHGPGIDARGATFPGVTSTSSSATAATTPGARRRRPRTTSTPSPRSSARTTSTTSTRAMPADGEARAHEQLDAERLDTTPPARRR